MIETDVRMTKDGVIIVAHDDNCVRLCGHKESRKISEMNLNELPHFKEQLNMHFSKSQRLKLKQDDQNYFSTLEEVFQTIPKDIVIQIELKDKEDSDA